MDMPMNGLAEHACAAIGQKIWIPIGMEKYSSKVLISARCRFCGSTQFEREIDKAHLPTKGSYITA